MATNLPAYYHDNGYTRSVDAICGSYDIGRWFRPGVRPLFQKKPGATSININEGDALMYVKFNTDEKIELVEFDAHELDQLGFHSPINACITLKNQLPPTPLHKAYEYFDNARMRWNDKHDIKVKGYDVEIYVEDSRESHKSSGDYSILNDEWNKEPKK